jgi:hypothetical protein
VSDHLQTQGGAYGLAWAVWITYLMLPLFVFMGVVFYMLVNIGGLGYHNVGDSWFLTMMIWLAVGVPGAYFVRSRLFFRDFWAGRPVTPRQYFYGMVLIWTVIEIAGVFSLLGCLFTGELVPNIIPALFAFILFITQWPNASAMTESTGQKADSTVFRHPR